MALTIERITPGTPRLAQVRSSALEFARDTVPRVWRCNARTQVDRMTYPSAGQLRDYIADTTKYSVFVAMEGRDFHGFIVFQDLRGSGHVREGGRILWVMATPARALEASKALCDQGVALYGWVWGRVTNQLIRDAFLVDPDCSVDPDDLEILRYHAP